MATCSERYSGGMALAATCQGHSKVQSHSHCTTARFRATHTALAAT
jgi:hypothetical protein